MSLIVTMPARRHGGGGGGGGGRSIHVAPDDDHDDGEDFPKDDGLKEEDPFDDNAEANGDRAQNQAEDDAAFLNAHCYEDALEGLHEHDEDRHACPAFHESSLLHGVVEEEQDVEIGHPGAEEGENSLLFPEEGGG